MSQDIESNETANLVYFGNDRSLKETFGRRVTPIFIFRAKLNICQMARDTSHDYIAMAPDLTEIKVKGIVLNVSVASVGL